MNRYNIFNQIHKGLRSLLYETALLIQRTDFLNKEESNIALDKVREVVELLEKHAHTEDTYVLPQLADYEPAVVNVFEEEHVRDHELSEKLLGYVYVLTQSQLDNTKVEMGRALSIAYVEFMIFNLNHMAKEETVINKLLWRYYTDEQLQGITRTIVSNSPPEAFAKMARHMIRGINNAEILTWFAQVKATAPPFVYAGLAAIAAAEVPERWEIIRNRMNVEEALVA